MAGTGGRGVGAAVTAGVGGAGVTGTTGGTGSEGGATVAVGPGSLVGGGAWLPSGVGLRSSIAGGSEGRWPERAPPKVSTAKVAATTAATAAPALVISARILPFDDDLFMKPR